MRSTIDHQRQLTVVTAVHGVAGASASAEYLATLERRLADGYARIEDARTRGQDVTAWEAFWIDLLHHYEMAVDGLPEAA